MAEQPKSNCHQNCGSGLYMPKGKGKTPGLLGRKGERYDCMGCGKPHIFNERGEFLGFGE